MNLDFDINVIWKVYCKFIDKLKSNQLTESFYTLTNQIILFYRSSNIYL